MTHALLPCTPSTSPHKAGIRISAGRFIYPDGTTSVSSGNSSLYILGSSILDAGPDIHCTEACELTQSAFSFLWGSWTHTLCHIGLYYLCCKPDGNSSSVYLWVIEAFRPVKKVKVKVYVGKHQRALNWCTQSPTENEKREITETSEYLAGCQPCKPACA